MPLALLFHYLMLNMFRMSVLQPAYGYHTTPAIVLQPAYGYHTTTAIVLQPAYGYHTTPAKLQRNTNTHRTQINITHEITQQISRKLLRMDVLTSETC